MRMSATRMVWVRSCASSMRFFTRAVWLKEPHMSAVMKVMMASASITSIRVKPLAAVAGGLVSRRRFMGREGLSRSPTLTSPAQRSRRAPGQRLGARRRPRRAGGRASLQCHVELRWVSEEVHDREDLLRPPGLVPLDLDRQATDRLLQSDADRFHQRGHETAHETGQNFHGIGGLGLLLRRLFHLLGRPGGQLDPLDGGVPLEARKPLLGEIARVLALHFTEPNFQNVLLKRRDLGPRQEGGGGQHAGMVGGAHVAGHRAGKNDQGDGQDGDGDHHLKQ